MKIALLSLPFFLSFKLCYSQVITRQNIGCMGQTYSSNEIHVQSSTGQSSSIGTNQHASGIGIRQGFVQPIGVFKSEDQSLQVSVYPNPNTGLFFIQPYFSSEEKYDILLHDQHGKLIYQSKGFGNLSKENNIDNIQSGSYILTVRTASNQTHVKLIIH
jgi:hypothetical protein